jgi:hypothetical protein
VAKRTSVGDAHVRHFPPCRRCCGSTLPPLVHVPGENLGLLVGPGSGGAAPFASSCLSRWLQVGELKWRLPSFRALWEASPIHGGPAHLGAMFERLGRGRWDAGVAVGWGSSPHGHVCRCRHHLVPDTRLDCGHGWCVLRNAL